MTTRTVLIIGIGKRVIEVALPALARIADRFTVADVRARTARPAADGLPEVKALDALTAEEFAAIDLVYVAVGKPAVPAVLARLARFDRAGTDLLLETPVLVMKQFRHAPLLRGWRNAWVAEDCRWLPWIDTVRAVEDAGTLGDVREVEFAHSAWKYHGLAMLKTLLRDDRVRTARRIGGVDAGRRELRFAGGGRGVVLEPRDYATGTFTITGTKGRLSDDPSKDALTLALDQVDGAVRGFTAGDVSTTLDDDEVALLHERSSTAGVTARMEDWKRIGFLRLLRSIAAGDGAYPVPAGLDDMLVDYLLDKVGRASSWSTHLIKRLTRLPS